jgi:hypothetical protein
VMVRDMGNRALTPAQYDKFVVLSRDKATKMPRNGQKKRPAGALRIGQKKATARGSTW